MTGYTEYGQKKQVPRQNTAAALVFFIFIRLLGIFLRNYALSTESMYSVSLRTLQL